MRFSRKKFDQNAPKKLEPGSISTLANDVADIALETEKCKRYFRSVGTGVRRKKMNNRIAEIQKWIPVKERRPEPYIKVLTCGIEGHIHIMEDSPEHEKPFGIDRHHSRYHMISHWMPLPEPPKEGAEE